MQAVYGGGQLMCPLFPDYQKGQNSAGGTIDSQSEHVVFPPKPFFGRDMTRGCLYEDFFFSG